MIKLKNSGIPIYLQIYNAIRDDINNGVLVYGNRLEPERKLAKRLNINRSTVNHAYQKLYDDGFIVARQGSAHTVAKVSNILSADSLIKAKITTPLLYLERNNNLRNDNIYDAVVANRDRKNGYYFTGVVIPEELYPTEFIGKTIQALLEEEGARLYGYCAPQGLPELRTNISHYLQKKQIDVPPNKILIGHEIMQMLDYVLQIYIKPGDTIIASEPIFPHTYQLFKINHANVVTIPMDNDGMRIDLLERELQRNKPKLIYVMPTFHNPTNITMSPERQMHLLKLAYAYGVPIVEHAFLEDLQHAGRKIFPLKSLDINDFVIHISVFNQSYVQGIPISFVVASQRTIDAMTGLVQLTILQMSTLDQYIFSRCLSSGNYDAQVEKVSRVYKVKQEIMYEELDKCAVLGLTYHKNYGGGMVWCMLPDYVDSKKLLQDAQRANLYYHPGELFYPNSREGRRYLRLSFLYPSEVKIREGIGILADLIQLQRENCRMINAANTDISNK